MNNNIINNRKLHYGERILAHDIRVSNDTRETGLNNNDLIIGSSGAGKTGGYVIPNIQNLTGSLVVSDTKGNLARRFKMELIRKGYRVYTLDFVNPMESCGYNPLAYIRQYPDGSYREQDILTVANAICPVLDAREPIWDKSAASYLAFLISFCLESLPKTEHTLHTVCELHRAFIQPHGELGFEDWLTKNPKSFPNKKYQEIKANSVADKMWASIIGFVNETLGPFEFKESQYIFSCNRNLFDIRSLGREKTVLFLNVSDTDSTYDNTVNLFHTQVLQVLCQTADANHEDGQDGRLKVPVRIILDDFATSAKIPDFDKIISVIRSRDISVSIILQSLTQLESMYEHAAAMTIVDNCDHLLYLGTQNQETAEFVGCRAFKTADYILCMPLDKAYLLTKGAKAKLIDKLRPYSTINDNAERSDYESLTGIHCTEEIMP